MSYRGRDLNPRAVSVRLLYPSGEEMTLNPGEGNLSIDPLPTTGNEKMVVTDRGDFDGFVEGPYVPQGMTITVRQLNEQLTRDDVARLEDFFNKAGYFADATDASDVEGTFGMVITYSTGSGTTTKTYSVCEGTFTESHQFPSNTYALTIRSHVKPTIANV